MGDIPVHRFPPAYGARPRIRAVEAREVEIDGQRFFALHDPGSAGDDELVLPPEGLAVAVYFDGTRDLRDVQRAIQNEHGQLLYVERIDEVARALHRAGLFESTQAPAPGSVRPPAHAGSSYEGDPQRLAPWLDEFFRAAAASIEAPPPDAEPPAVVGIVAPHIDLHRGGLLYAHAYRALAAGTDADLFVVFGTAHASPQSLFTLTRQDYDTPLGLVPTDRAALSVLERRLGADVFRDEAVHADEHSIEFQALLLRHVVGGRPFSMLPVLCSSLYPWAAQGGRGADEPAVARFLDALAEATAGRRVCYIAAADLSHLGVPYGDPAAPSPRQLEDVAVRDRVTLARIEAGDAEGFFADVAPDEETRRICGLTPIYLLLRATDGARGRLLRYHQWVGAEEQSAVTFAAAVLERS